MREATIRVMLITAIWRDPAVFSGWFDVDDGTGQRPLRYPFRAERSRRGEEAELRFTRLKRQKVDFGGASSAVHQALAFALERALELLEARTLQRFDQGRGVPGAPAELSDLGFEVSFPFRAEDEEASRVLEALTARPSSG
jgi:hypothetical protein